MSSSKDKTLNTLTRETSDGAENQTLVKHTNEETKEKDSDKKETAINVQAKMTPSQELRYYVSRGDEEKIRELVQIGADVNAFDEGEKSEDINRNSKVLEKVAPKVSHDYPLHIAAENNFVKVISQLFYLGAKMENKNRIGSTALHRAVSTGHIEAATELLNLGADARAVNHMGQTPLHLAVMLNNLPMVKMLVTRGANKDLHTTNKVKLTPIEYTLPQSEMRKFLLECDPALAELVPEAEPTQQEKDDDEKKSS